MSIAKDKPYVLLVEDYEPNIVMTTAFFDELACGYDVARNGFEALDKFAATRYGMIFMDIQMPELDGMETARRIRALEKQSGADPVPIVAVTAHANEDDRLLCLKAGMNDCLSKPFRLEDLENALRRFL